MVSHAPGLADATLRNIYPPAARNSATQSGGPAPASGPAQDPQHEEAGQVRQSKRAKTSTASHASQPAPLQQVEPEPGEEQPPAALVNQSSMAMHKTDLPGALQRLLARRGQAHGTSEQQPMEIFMKTTTGRTATFMVYRNTTVQVGKLLNWPMHSCQLEVQGGEQLLASQPYAMTALVARHGYRVQRQLLCVFLCRNSLTWCKTRRASRPVRLGSSLLGSSWRMTGRLLTITFKHNPPYIMYSGCAATDR